MKIVMDELQYQELEILIDILEGMFLMMRRYNCFNYIKTIVYDELYIENIEKENKELIKNSIFI